MNKNSKYIPRGADRLTTAGQTRAAALAMVSLPRHLQQESLPSLTSPVVSSFTGASFVTGYSFFIDPDEAGLTLEETRETFPIYSNPIGNVKFKYPKK